MKNISVFFPFDRNLAKLNLFPDLDNQIPHNPSYHITICFNIVTPNIRELILLCPPSLSSIFHSTTVISVVAITSFVILFISIQVSDFGFSRLSGLRLRLLCSSLDKSKSQIVVLCCLIVQLLVYCREIF